MRHVLMLLALCFFSVSLNAGVVRIPEMAAANAVAITGGAIDGAVIGGTTAAAVTGTTITATTFTDGTASISSGAISAATNVTGTGTADFAKLLSEKIVLDTVQTFVDEDTTPDVGDYSYFNSNTSAVTITDFDGSNIEDGQIIYVISKGAITYDVTSSGIKGGTTDIVTAAGDVTAFLYDGTDWYVTARIDASDDLN